MSKTFNSLKMYYNEIYLFQNSPVQPLPLADIVSVLRGQHLILIFDVNHCDACHLDLRKEMVASCEVIEKYGLFYLAVSNAVTRGASDAQHLLGFGSRLGSFVTPRVQAGLPCTVWHMLDGGMEGKLPTVLMSIP
jgi:hypothetical protein